MNAKQMVLVSCVWTQCLATVFGGATQSLAGAGLANPAAEHCIAQGGYFGIREEDAGNRGICDLPSGGEVDAWTYYRDHLSKVANMDKTEIANPAATYCSAVGGKYILETSMCLLPDGSTLDAWALLREAHSNSVSLANPAATHCIEVGGAYEIRNGDNGQFGVCRFPDGTEKDAWALYRETG